MGQRRRQFIFAIVCAITLSVPLAARRHKPHRAAARPRHAARAPETAPVSTNTYEIGFRDQLQVAAELRLSGKHSSRSLGFFCEATRKPIEGSALHLFLEHAPDLDPDRSFLSVSLNYGILRSVRLDQDNEEASEVVIPVPPNLLKRKNELVFSAEQAPGARNAAGAVWTSIAPRSYLEIRFEPAAPAMDLALLPAPLLDPYSYRPQAFDVLRPGTMSAESLEATALLAANFASRLAPKPVATYIVDSIADARHPLLIVGTPEEQPQLRALARPPADAEGLAGVTLAGDSLPVLYVTGRSPRGVLWAARRLALSRGPISGTVLRAASDTAYIAAAPREWQGFIPPGSRFSLADLGYQELQFTQENDYSLTIALNATPDARFFREGLQLTLWLALDPEVQRLPCTLAASWNGTELGREAPRSISRTWPAPWTLSLPGALVAERNSLRVTLEGLAGKTDLFAAGGLLPNTHLYLPRDYETALPDLALLRKHLYPLSLRGDLSNTVILLPETIGNPMFTALLELAGALGRLAPSPRLAFAVRRPSNLTEEERRQSHFILLGVAPQQVFPAWPAVSWRRLFGTAPLVQEAVSPWNARRVVLSLDGAAIGELFSGATLDRLTGDTAFLTPRIDCFQVSPRRRIEQSFYFTHLENWMRVNWVALPLILVAVSGLLFLGLRLALDRYKNLRGG